jgi:hypothetical protein
MNATIEKINNVFALIFSSYSWDKEQYREVLFVGDEIGIRHGVNHYSHGKTVITRLTATTIAVRVSAGINPETREVIYTDCVFNVSNLRPRGQNAQASRHTELCSNMLVDRINKVETDRRERRALEDELKAVATNNTYWLSNEQIKSAIALLTRAHE